MGLDMELKKINRGIYDNMPREVFYSYLDPKTAIPLIYWRKEDDIDEWFRNNTTIDEEHSDEITKYKLKQLVLFLEENNLKDDATKVQDVIDNTDFTNDVIFYTAY